MHNSSWAHNFKFADKDNGLVSLAPDCDQPLKFLTLRLQSFASKAYMSVGLRPDEVRGLINAAQTWLGQVADAERKDP